MASSLPTSTSGLRVAAFVKSGENQTSAVQRAPGIFEVRGVGNSYLLTTGDGDVLVNTGTLADARRGSALFQGVSQRPIRYIILTQGHVNQYGGLEIYKTSANQVIAHRNYPEDRRYAQALGAHYQRGSRRIFGSLTGPTSDLLPTREIPPDVLVDDHHVLSLGGRHFEILWIPGGETRSSMAVWLPDEKVVLVGNLFGPLFGNQPNLSTLRGDKPRSALEFIRSVKRVRDLRAEILITGHETIRGAEHIERETSRIAESVQWIHDRTLQGMNAGADLRTLMKQIKPPIELSLTEEYGKVSWNVRAIWHEYTGWFDPSLGLTELYAVPASSIARELAELSGGPGALARRGGKLVEVGEPLKALHLLNIALAADPHNLEAKNAKREALSALLASGAGENFWERMSIAAELREIDAEDKQAEGSQK